MPKRTSKTGSELFIVDNSDDEWKVLRYLHDWCPEAKGLDIATGYFEIGGILALADEWQKVDAIRILMGDDVSKRTKAAFIEGLAYPADPDKEVDKFLLNRQKQVVRLIRTQFLKRFESSAHAFQRSCFRLFQKLYAFASKNSTTHREKARLVQWKTRNAELINYRPQQRLWTDNDDEEDVHPATGRCTRACRLSYPNR